MKLWICGFLLAFSALAADDAETVITTFRVKAGKEADFARAHAKAWPAYQKAEMVLSEPHIVLRGKDASGKTYFVEILSWKSHETPDHAPTEVQAIWQDLEALCEARDGHSGIEFPEVTVVKGTP